MSDVQIGTVRIASIFAIAMQVAPLVRRNVLTPDEGRMLVNHRYYSRCAELRREQG